MTVSGIAWGIYTLKGRGIPRSVDFQLLKRQCFSF